MFVESDDGYGPFGAKSMGEASKIPALAAVANAIFNAIGRRMKDLPITRDKIVRLASREVRHESLHQRQSARSRSRRVTFAQQTRVRRVAASRSPAAAAICSGW